MSLDRKHRSHGRSDDLHGNAPDDSRVVLLRIDVIDDLSFPDNKNLSAPVGGAGEIDRQTEEAMQEGDIPAIYVNDNRADGVLISPPCCVIASTRNPRSRNDESACSRSGRLQIDCYPD